METIAQRKYKENPDRVFAVLLEVLAKKDFEIKRSEPSIRLVEISTSMSLLSFGESFEIIVGGTENDSVVRVKSKSRIRWNITSQTEEKTKEILNLIENRLN
ncbi:MAG: hypothetical protein GWN01_10255 [Nitrosopumilaceae archaeon]|nr:hypothetical protein [Nitrosopumilaceae archaeon]NIU01283.1 hypothetical protein [Nitrosopumilaceae archaeon]NIU87631.1 hypothetical protein [Nitrosopumilaceae archaeon]NIV66056.1 hypothetical protein [Nitrosopumilaceae archaeon]NIX61885.1 hypothetical protein [Nitrosopumilaceae archaeon]